MIVDANVILRAYFPDEAQAQARAAVRDHVAGRTISQAPALLPYELTNAVWQAERRGRIKSAQADEILESISGLDIEIIPQSWRVMLPIARQIDRSAYDAAYLALGQATGQPLLTGDLRLYNAVHSTLDWVQWIEDYPIEIQP